MARDDRKQMRMRMFPWAAVPPSMLIAAGLACQAREPQQSSAAPTSPAAAAPAPSPVTPDPQRLVGRWLRADSDYTIEIASVGADGKLEARYFNPNPIHVSRAGAQVEGGALKMLLELQDRGYPGSYYTLTYDPGSDSLSGVYHHLGLSQDFDVAFSRLGKPGETPAN